MSHSADVILCEAGFNHSFSRLCDSMSPALFVGHFLSFIFTVRQLPKLFQLKVTLYPENLGWGKEERNICKVVENNFLYKLQLSTKT